MAMLSNTFGRQLFSLHTAFAFRQFGAAPLKIRAGPSTHVEALENVIDSNQAGHPATWFPNEVEKEEPKRC
jgi:hypothetical protein